MAMLRLTRSQILQSLLASLLALTPLFSSSSLRSTYLYFIINLLIIALSAEAGLLSLLVSNPNPNSDNNLEAIVLDHADTKDDTNSNMNSSNIKMKPGAVEKCMSEKLGPQAMINKSVNQVKKCPSTPSIFFIGGAGDQRQDQDQDHHQVRLEIRDNNMELDEEELDVVGLGGSQDQLFTKAENFIGNFYKQLKMQREESWNKIHGFYQKFTE